MFKVKKLVIILIIAIFLVGIVGGYLYYEYFYPYSGNAPAITEKELECGSYYGGYNQKKPGTPDDWIHSGEGTRSALWHASGEFIHPMDCNDELVVGECAAVSEENIQSCCGQWASENGIVHIQCVGKWAIENSECSWKCEQANQEIFKISKSFSNGFCPYDCSTDLTIDLQNRTIQYRYSNNTNANLTKSRTLSEAEYSKFRGILNKESLLDLEVNYSCEDAPTDAGANTFRFFYGNSVKEVERYNGCPLPSELIGLNDELKKIKDSL